MVIGTGVLTLAHMVEKSSPVFNFGCEILCL